MKSDHAVLHTVTVAPNDLRDLLVVFDVARFGWNDQYKARFSGDNPETRVEDLRKIVETLIAAAPNGLRIDFHASVSAPDDAKPSSSEETATNT